MQTPDDSDYWDNVGKDPAFNRVLSDEEDRQIDDMLGLEKIEVRLAKPVLEALINKAAEDGIILKAYIRKVLQDHVAV